MGEFFDMCEEGLLCPQCGVAIEDSKGDFLQLCPSCAREESDSTKKKSKGKSK